MSRLSDIPTNIITGFLGVGKTTAINRLLSQKPENEVWTILVNEFGQIGIDQQALPQDEDGVVIKELAGGCICCALGPALTVTLATLLRRSKPDRLIIEPTGMGHPAGIIDTLQSPQFKDVLDLRSVICLVDPRSLDNKEVIGLPTFQDQINLADVIVLNKTDIADETATQTAMQVMNNIFPPKQAVISSVQGHVSLDLLDYVRLGKLAATFPNAHKETPPRKPETNMTQPVDLNLHPQPRQPLSKQGSQSGLYSCGWVFHPEDIFCAETLYHYLQNLPNMQRIKGVFHTDTGWVFFNQVEDEFSITPLAYRRDSRVEIISRKQHDWKDISDHLIQQLKTDPKG